jgi:hypothetical protein
MIFFFVALIRIPNVPVNLTTSKAASLLAALSSQTKTYPLIFATAMADASPNPRETARYSKSRFSSSPERAISLSQPSRTAFFTSFSLP